MRKEPSTPVHVLLRRLLSASLSESPTCKEPEGAALGVT